MRRLTRVLVVGSKTATTSKMMMMRGIVSFQRMLKYLMRLRSMFLWDETGYIMSKLAPFVKQYIRQSGKLSNIDLSTNLYKFLICGSPSFFLLRLTITAGSRTFSQIVFSPSLVF
jgi:hypothetical protein